MASAELRLAHLLLTNPDRAMAEATRIWNSALAKRRRVLAKSAPRRKVEKADTRHGWEVSLEIRQTVFARSGDKCEACFLTFPTELHHVLGGQGRRVRESAENCAAICRDCHRAAHRNDPGTLGNLRALMMRAGSIEAVRSLTHRIDKITRSTTP